MSPTQVLKTNSDELSRCKEQLQMADHEKCLSPTQKTDAAIKNQIDTALLKDAVLRATEYDQINIHVKTGLST